MKPVKGWVVITPKGNPLTTISFHKYRRTSMYMWVEYNGVNTWDSYYNHGYRCIRVTLRSDK